jgi:hypothetical protein
LTHAATERKADPNSASSVTGALRDRETKAKARRLWARQAQGAGAGAASAPTDRKADPFQRTGDPRADAARLIEQHKHGMGLDEKGLGKALAGLVRDDPVGSKALVEQTFGQLQSRPWFRGGDNKGQVAAQFVASFSGTELEKLQASTAGKAILQEASKTLRRNGISSEEARQLTRLHPYDGPRPTAQQIQEIQNLLQVGTKEARDEAIRKTIAYYRIDTTKANGISYNPSLTDYGQMNGFGEVQIGKPAFSSPAMLASTLAHECEVHAGAQLDNRLYRKGTDGGALNEIEAYDHEIENADRFGLSESELQVIVGNRNHYYRQLSDAAKQLADEKTYVSPWDTPFWSKGTSRP